MTRTACLGWGSLVWDPRELPLKSTWSVDGPAVRVEFLRQSVRSKRVTLVLDPSGPLVQSLWAELDVESSAAGRRALRLREGVREVNEQRSIGLWETGNSDPSLIGGLSHWAATHNVDAVVWTALQPRWGEQSRVPTLEEVLRYLRGLSIEDKVNAEKYIRCAPVQIDTPFRRSIETALQWTPVAETQRQPADTHL
jgi:hypothetical protein